MKHKHRLPHRRFVVLASLVAVVTLTSALLLALAPAPLNPDTTSSLFAIDAPQSMDTVFQTDVPLRTGRWKYIFIHHSRTPDGNAQSIFAGDHFVIGNGEGLGDGEIQLGQRWSKQTQAAPAGTQEIDPDCISICLIGDFDRTAPTPTQLRRLGQLVTELQGRLRISGKRVIQRSVPNSAAGAGRYFPTNAFVEQILP